MSSDKIRRMNGNRPNRGRVAGCILLPAAIALFTATDTRAKELQPQRGLPEAVPARKGPQWHHAYEPALEAAQKTNRPMLLSFHADWCGWCETLEREVFASPQAAPLLERFVCARIDIDRHPHVARAYQVRSLPRTIFINTHGEVMGDHLGYKELKQFLPQIQQHLNDANKPLEAGKIPKVRPMSPAAPAPPVDVQVDLENKDQFLALLGDPRPEVRRRVLEVVAEQGARTLQVLLPALESDYLGARIAAWKAIRAIQPDASGFDPWAPQVERARAIAKLAKILAREAPKPSPAPDAAEPPAAAEDKPEAKASGAKP